MYIISKDFHFSASHRLDHLPETHKCHRLHGHNYVARVVLAADRLDERGFVADYAEMDVVKQFIDRQWDHQHLNDLLGGGRYTTAEHIAHVLLNKCVSYKLPVAAVGVQETPKTWAWCIKDRRFMPLVATGG